MDRKSHAIGARTIPLLGVLVVAFWPARELSSVLSFGMPQLAEVIAIVFPVGTLVVSVAAAFSSGESSVLSVPAALLRGAAVGSAASIPMAAGLGILHQPARTLLSAILLMLATAIMGHMVATAVQRFVAGEVMKRGVTWSVLVGWMVVAALFIPTLNPVSVMVETLTVPWTSPTTLVPYLALAVGTTAVMAGLLVVPRRGGRRGREENV